MPKKQIFCFTYAGGNATLFELVKMEYSGHGTRHKEPLYMSFDELADDMYAGLKSKYNGSEYALFGYSMGTISLVEVLKRIITDQKIPLPGHVFLAAHEPMTKAALTAENTIPLSCYGCTECLNNVNGIRSDQKDRLLSDKGRAKKSGKAIAVFFSHAGFSEFICSRRYYIPPAMVRFQIIHVISGRDRVVRNPLGLGRIRTSGRFLCR